MGGYDKNHMVVQDMTALVVQPTHFKYGLDCSLLGECHTV